MAKKSSLFSRILARVTKTGKTAKFAAIKFGADIGELAPAPKSLLQRLGIRAGLVSASVKRPTIRTVIVTPKARRKAVTEKETGRPLTVAEVAKIRREDRRLKLVRAAREAFEREGLRIAAEVRADRAQMFAEVAAGRRAKRERDARRWTGLEADLDGAIGPDTGAAVASRELPNDIRITDGQWHGLIDALKARAGENSPMVKLLRSSGRYVEGGAWVTK